MDPVILKAIEEAIKTAVGQGRGYESILVIVAFVALAVAFGWVFKNNAAEGSKRIDTILADAASREKRMGERINTLEDFQRGDLQALSKETKAALVETAGVIGKLNTTLERSPCLWSEAKRQEWLAGKATSPMER